MLTVPATFHVFRGVRTVVVLIVFVVVTWTLLRSLARSEQQAHGTETEDDQNNNNSPFPTDQELCSPYGWKPYRKPADAPARKVYDLCMVNDELDWLEIRLNTLWDHVDFFVVVEAPTTFTGLPKAMTIRDHWDRFAPYHSKILYHQLIDPPNFDPKRPWDREDLQRNALFEQVLDIDTRASLLDAAGSTPPPLPDFALPNEGDVLVVADVDEIPRPMTLQTLRRCSFPRRLTLLTRFFYYGFQFRHLGRPWPHPQATVYAGDHGGTILPVHLRNGDGGGLRGLFQRQDMPDAGWHCSSCFATLAELLRKMESFSHQWMNQDVFRDRDRIVDRVRHAKDLWDRPADEFEEITDPFLLNDIPQTIQDNRLRYQYLLNRTQENAGFTDYP